MPIFAAAFDGESTLANAALICVAVAATSGRPQSGELPPAAISVGFNPTFSDARDQVRIEAHLLDFDEDVYGSPIRLDLVRRLRDEERFNSIDELIAQMHRDVDAVRAEPLAAPERRGA